MSNVVEQWAATKPRFKELGPLISKMIKQTPKDRYFKDDAQVRDYLDGLYKAAAAKMRNIWLMRLAIFIGFVVLIVMTSPQPAVPVNHDLYFGPVLGLAVLLCFIAPFALVLFGVPLMFWCIEWCVEWISRGRYIKQW
jgi:hypothetical protein